MDGRSLRAAVEPEVRCLVAEQLGVSPEDLAPEVSLPDDLAADSLDLVELCLALESRWGVIIPERRLEAVRSFADLVDAVVSGIAARRTPAPTIVSDVAARYRIVPRAGARPHRAGPLDPYSVELLLDEARRSGSGTRLHLEVGPGSEETVAAVRDRLGRDGVALSVRPLDPSAAPSTVRPPRPASGSPR